MLFDFLLQISLLDILNPLGDLLDSFVGILGLLDFFFDLSLKVPQSCLLLDLGDESGLLDAEFLQLLLFAGIRQDLLKVAFL